MNMTNQKVMFESLKAAAINAKNTENFFVSIVNDGKEDNIEFLYIENKDQKNEIGLRVTCFLDRYSEIDYKIEAYGLDEETLKLFNPSIVSKLREGMDAGSAILFLEARMKTIFAVYNHNKAVKIKKEEFKKRQAKILLAIDIFGKEFEQLTSLTIQNFEDYKHKVFFNKMEANDIHNVLTGVSVVVMDKDLDWVRLDLSVVNDELVTKGSTSVWFSIDALSDNFKLDFKKMLNENASITEFAKYAKKVCEDMQYEINAKNTR